MKETESKLLIFDFFADILDCSNFEEDDIELDNEDDQAIINMLQVRINDQELDEDLWNVNDTLGDRADIFAMQKHIEDLKRQSNQFVIMV